MVQFSHPAALLLLLALPPLLWWWLRRRRAALRYPATGWLAPLPRGRRGWLARWGGAALRGTALALLVIAIANPRWPDQRTRIRTEGIAIDMLVDVSTSMAQEDFDWDGAPVSRLEAARRAFDLFIAGGDGPDGQHFEGRPDDLVGLVLFGHRPEPTCPLTLSHSVLLGMLKEQKALPVSDTNVSDAVVVGVHRLRQARPKRKALIVLSDGEHNVLDPQSGWTPRQAAQIAASLGVRVYAIDAGGDLSPDEPAGKDASTAAREQGVTTLKELARITNGKYFQARDTQALLAVCREIDEALEREPIESFQYRRYYEGYPWLGLGAFVLLLTVHLLERTVWLRIP